jgi:hypothetical protein
MHPTFTADIATDRVADLHRQAHHFRLAREVRRGVERTQHHVQPRLWSRVRTRSARPAAA